MAASRRDEIESRVKDGKQMVLVRFTAANCPPCDLLEPHVKTTFEKLTSAGAICYDQCIDKDAELYGFLKTKKMVPGTPTVLAYYPGERDERTWYAPDRSVIGFNLEELRELQRDCLGILYQ